MRDPLDHLRQLGLGTFDTSGATGTAGPMDPSKAKNTFLKYNDDRFGSGYIDPSTVAMGSLDDISRWIKSTGVDVSGVFRTGDSAADTRRQLEYIQRTTSTIQNFNRDNLARHMLSALNRLTSPAPSPQRASPAPPPNNNYVKRQQLMRAPASDLDKQPKIAQMQEARLAAGAAVPLVYGPFQIAGLPVDVSPLTYAVCLGPIGGISAVYANGTSVTFTTSSVSGIVTVTITSGTYTTLPRVVVEGTGKQVRTSAAGSYAYSADPVYHLADFIESPSYGLGYAVDWTSISASGLSRSTVFTSPQDVWSCANTLKAAARSYLRIRGTIASIHAETTGTSSMTIGASDIVRGSLSVKLRDMSSVPNAVQVGYTDTSGTIWTDGWSAEAQSAAYASGLEKRRLSRINMPGVQSLSDANAEAIRRLNILGLNTLQVSFEMFDDALPLEIGDIVTFAHPVGLSSQLLRVEEDPIQVRPGRWRISCGIYDADMYSGTVQV